MTTEKLELKRKEFEESEWIIASDSYEENPKADPNCPTCKGHGILDNGGGWGYLPIDCTDCWKPK